VCRKLADGLFLESCRAVSRLYPDIAFSDMIIDNCSMQVQHCRCRGNSKQVAGCSMLTVVAYDEQLIGNSELGGLSHSTLQALEMS
jgi:hypothetical protein